MTVYRVLIRLFVILIKLLQIIRKSKNVFIIDNLALQQQLRVYQTKQTKPKINDLDRPCWVALKQTWNK